MVLICCNCNACKCNTVMFVNINLMFLTRNPAQRKHVMNCGDGLSLPSKTSPVPCLSQPVPEEMRCHFLRAPSPPPCGLGTF